MNKKIEMQVNDKSILLEGYFVGNLFCVKGQSINEHPSLNDREKESIKNDLRSNKNILLEE